MLNFELLCLIGSCLQLFVLFADNAVAQCRQNEYALETKVQQLQQQLESANTAVKSFK